MKLLDKRQTAGRIRVLSVTLLQLCVLDQLVLGEVLASPRAAVSRERGEGLSGVVDGSVPTDLSDGLAAMRRAVSGERVMRQWADFLDSIATDLEELYSGQATLERERELVRRLATAVHRMRVTLGLRDAASLADDLSVLASRLERRVGVLAPALDLLASPDLSEDLRIDVRDLLRNIEEHQVHPSPDIARTMMATYGRLKRSHSPQAGELADAFNTLYNHYNVRLVVSGGLLDRLARATRTDSGPVRDYVLGADVYGDQTTIAHVGARLMPNSAAASYLLQVEGQTDAETKSYPRQECGSVAINSRSVSRFVTHRRIDLTADGLRAGEPVISVVTTNRVVGASTPYSSIPIMGSIATSIAMGEAAARREEAEAIGAARVRERVLPRFASESDERISEMNESYRSRFVDRLTKRNAFPDVLDFSTSSTHLFALGRTARFHELGGHEPLMWQPGGSQLTVQLHESAINNAVEHAELGGEKVDQNTIGRLTAEAEGEMREEAAPQPEEESTISITLADRAPVRVRFQDGLVHLEFRAAMVQRAEETLANQLVTVRYGFEPLERTLKVVRQQEIELRPLDDSQDGRQDPEMVARFRDALELIFLPQFEVGAAPKLTNRQGDPVPLRLAELKILDGWLSVSLR